MSVSLVRVEAPEDGDRSEMCGYSDSGIEVSLPSVLGRGSLLKCGEKKVSRRHAFLDWEENGVQLTAVHQNPTFIMTRSGGSNSERVIEVTEGSSALLCHGDKFGFLRHRFWYMIHFSSTLLKEEMEDKERGGEKEGNKKAKEKVEIEEKMEREEENIGDRDKEAGGREKWKERGTKEESWEVNGEVHQEEEGKNENPDQTRMNRAKESSKEEKEDKKKMVEDKNENKNQTITKETTPSSKEKKEGSKEEDDILKTAKEDKISGHEKNVGMGESLRAKTQSTPSTSTSSTSSFFSSHTTSSPSSLPKREDVKEVLAAMSNRKRRLPQWIMDITASSAAPTSTLTPKTTPSRHHCQNQKKPQRASTTHTPTSTPRPANPQVGDEDLFSLSTLNERKRKEPPNSPRQFKGSPQETKRSPCSTVKQGGGGGGTHHQMSDESGGEEEHIDLTTVTTFTVTTTATSTAATAASAATTASHQSSTHHPTGNQISDSEEEKEEDLKGVGRVFELPSTASYVSSTPQSVPTVPAPFRPSCQYGAKCYRKNPQHKESEAHPGDDDYHSTVGDDSDSDNDSADDSRPECEYGINCYRQNPQHRRAFRHSRVPQPQRRAKRKARQQKGRRAGGGSDNESEGDDYDLDDPFLYDGSSDDYAPTDDSSDSAAEASQEAQEEEDEDTRRMLKEAKKFVKKRR